MSVRWILRSLTYEQTTRNTPFTPSKYPDAGSFRVATAAKFQATDSNYQFFLVNTHLDDRSDAQRRLGASLLLHRLKHEVARDPDIPVFVTGDFNSQDKGNTSGAYSIITGAQAPVAVSDDFRAKFPVSDAVRNFKMVDAKTITPKVAIGGHHATFTGFGNVTARPGWTRIDFILGGNNGHW
jgi:endonuclease/exonuclease/phosphatase family metal-dependent hydrolase